MPKLSGIQWVLLLGIFLSLAAWLAMLAPWIMQAASRTEIAMNNGLYIRILTENGEIQGKPITAEPTSTATPKTQEDTPKPVTLEETPPATPTEPKPNNESPAPTPKDEAKPDAQHSTSTPNDTKKTEEKKTEGITPTPESSAATKEEPSPSTEIKQHTNPNAAPVTPVTATDTPAPHTEESLNPQITPPEEHTPTNTEALNLKPNEELIENVKGKSLPIISKEGLRPSRYYARQDATPKDAPSIALTISGLGLNEKLTLQAINELPANISLSFSPYAKDLEAWFAKAKKAGHEVWLDIPMEYADYPANDPGPLGLLKGKSEEENITRLQNTLASVVGYVGVIAPKDEIFTGYAMMDAMNGELAKRGLLLLLRSRAFKPDSDAEGVLYSSRSLIKEKSRTETIQSLQDLEMIAKDYSYAIGVVDTSESLLSIIKEWQKDLSKQNTYLIPLSAVPLRRK